MNAFWTILKEKNKKKTATYNLPKLQPTEMQMIV